MQRDEYFDLAQFATALRQARGPHSLRHFAATLGTLSYTTLWRLETAAFAPDVNTFLCLCTQLQLDPRTFCRPAVDYV